MHSSRAVLAARPICFGAISDRLALAPAVSSGGYRRRGRFQIAVGARHVSGTLAQFAWATLKQET